MIGFPSAVCVLSDPVAPIECWNELIAQFIRAKTSKISPFGLKAAIIFAQVSVECALILSQLGFKVNMMGGETEIRAASYKLSGQAKRGLRQSIERAKKSGIEVTEVLHPLSKSELDSIQLINSEFLSRHTPSARTSKFLNRELIIEDIFSGGCRLLVARKEDHMVGFAVLDPIKSNGKLRGYYANIVRSLSSAHSGTSSFLIHHAISLVKAGSCNNNCVLSLGLSPFHSLQQPSIFPNFSYKLKQCMEWTFQRCQSFYPYASIAASKAKWGGGSPVLINGGYSYPDPNVIFTPTFICHSEMSPALDLVRLGVLCGMLDLNIVKNLLLLWRGRGESNGC